jgi:hypothetical protein
VTRLRDATHVHGCSSNGALYRRGKTSALVQRAASPTSVGWQKNLVVIGRAAHGCLNDA